MKQVDDIITSLNNYKAKLDASIDLTTKMLKNPSVSPHAINTEIGKINKSIKGIIGQTYEINEVTKAMNVDTFGLPGLVVDVELEWVKDWLYIYIPELLPRRREEREKDKKYSKIMNEAALYLPSFEHFFSDKANRRTYDERVVFVYEFCTPKDRLKMDLDNYETRGITNILASNLLYDDSPAFLSLFYDYAITEEECTRIYVLPYSQLPIYLESKKERVF